MTTSTLVGSGYGRVVGLRGHPADLAAARALLPFWWHDSGLEPEVEFEVSSAAATPVVVRDLERWVAEFAAGFVFVHAAVVSVGGSAIVLPGRSGTGKTTLCAELLRRGGGYLSDEYAVLDTDGLVHPYPRPLQVRVDDERVGRSPAELGARTATGAAPVGLLAFLEHRNDAAWQVDTVSPATAGLRLLDNTVCARSRPAAALAATSAVAETARAVQGVRGEVAVAVASLLALIDQGEWR